MTISNNTIYTGNAFGVNVQLGGGTEKKFYNNIIQGKRVDNYEGILKFFVYTNTIARDIILTECDYNQFGNLDFLIRSKKSYTVNPIIDYLTLSAWQSSNELAGGGHPDVHSLASDPMFENASGTMLQLNDFRLASGSPCQGTGKNGVDMGADIDLAGSNLPDYTNRTVVFYSNGGTLISNVNIQQGSLLTEPADPVKAGYAFTGWYTSRDLAIEWDFANDPVEANVILYAKWQ
jgi:uncharacterized repeat protein (TIGR02543 family)